MDSEANLMKQVAQGNSKAFETVLNRYKSHVYGLCRRMMGTDMLAEDIAQDTWVRVVKAASQYSEAAPLKAWILRIAKNLCLNELRKRSWESELSPEMESSVQNSDETIESLLVDQSDLQRLKNCIDKLTDAQRTAVILSVTEEISHSEISTQMGIQVNAVKQLLFRARSSLGDCLGVQNEKR